MPTLALQATVSFKLKQTLSSAWNPSYEPSFVKALQSSVPILSGCSIYDFKVANRRRQLSKDSVSLLTGDTIEYTILYDTQSVRISDVSKATTVITNGITTSLTTFNNALTNEGVLLAADSPRFVSNSMTVDASKSAKPTGQPSNQPSSQPSKQPSSRPSSEPSSRPTSSCQPGFYLLNNQCIACPLGMSSVGTHATSCYRLYYHTTSSFDFSKSS
jgi:hypothetical protein